MSIEQIIAFQGEAQLMGWSETNTRGRTATFQFDQEGDTHPFAGARSKQGKQSGQRYAMVLVQIGDDERPVKQTTAQMAWLLCQDPLFQNFLNERSFVEVNDEDTAKACICEGCGIKSRSELDKDPGARSAWLTQFYNPWTAHKAAQEARLL
jgi:hypothetical protein